MSSKHQQGQRNNHPSGNGRGRGRGGGNGSARSNSKEPPFPSDGQQPPTRIPAIRNGLRPPARSAVGSMTEKRFNWLLDGSSPGEEKEKIESVKDARDFVAFILASPDKIETLSRLTSSEYGLKALGEALSLENDLNFVKNTVIPLIRFIGNDDRLTIGSSRGAAAIKLLRTIFKARFGLFANMVQFVVDRQLTDTEYTDVGWLVLQMLKGGDDFSLEAKHDRQVLRLGQALSTPGKFPMAKGVSDQINTLLEEIHKKPSSSNDNNQSIETIDTIRSSHPGWRHSNDKADFHSILLYPTADELTCDEDPFLPLTDTVLEREPRKVATYLDWAFRLLREDVNRVVEEELDALLPTRRHSSNSNPRLAGRLRGRTLNVRQFSEISCNQRFGVGFKMEFEEPESLTKLLDPKNMTVKAKEKVAKTYWEERANFLKTQSILAFIRNNSELVGLGVVNVRDLQELIKSPPSIDVFLFDKNDFQRIVLELGVTQQNLKAVQLSASFFAFVPILKRLKMLSSVPFEEELLHDGQAQAPAYFDQLEPMVIQLESVDSSTDLAPIVGAGKPVILDPSQKEAVTATLRRRVALIQGPPGTGKSFCGAVISKIIFDKSHETILCVTYTNHALDQFLLELISFGLPTNQIVRIGGAEKIDDRIKPITLFNLLKNQGQRDPTRMFRSLRDRMDAIRDEINTYKPWIEYYKNTRRMEDFAGFFSDEFREAFEGPEDRAEGFQMAGGKAGKALGHDYLWKQWIQGRDRGALKAVKGNWRDPDGSFWSMEAADRQHKVDEWRKQLIECYMEQLDKEITRYNELSDELNEMNQIAEIQLLKSKRIIGCTTTGAAKYATKLDAVSAGVLIMEEAGEILEAHVVTSMASNCKHLIMIGDHKQLRPKLNNHSLSVESNGPFKFNRSLFERLATKDFPCVTLLRQHRMRAEISDLVRQLTYPNLQDDDKVKDKTQRPDVRGLQSNVVFIHHEHPEGSNDEQFANGQVGDDTLSKINTHEVAMVAKIAQYLLRQGYQGKDIVILTPYLAQLHALRQEMSKVCQVILSELDQADLSRFGIDPTSQTNLPSTVPKNQAPVVRVSTIDNYQGEEANIVIASLVRSNSQGNIGFVGQPERVNVLLSRARQGLILIGDKKTFENCRSSKGRELWEKLLAMLHNQNAIFPGFPAHCPVHDARFCLAEPSDFDDKIGDGGCGEPCGKMLVCGKHVCPKKCHRFPANHDEIKCMAKEEYFCSKYQHSVFLQCGSTADVDRTCRKCVDIKKKDELDKKEAAARVAKEAQRQQELADLQRAVKEAEGKKKQVNDDERLEEQKMKLSHRQKVIEMETAQSEAESQRRLDEMKRQLNEQLQAKKDQIANKNDGLTKANGSINANALSAKENSSKPVQMPDKNGEKEAGNGLVEESSKKQDDKQCVPPSDLTSFVANSVQDQVAEIRCKSYLLTELFGLDDALVNFIFSTQSANAFPACLKRGIELAKEKRWLDALKYFDKLDASQAPDKAALCLLCRSQFNDASLKGEVNFPQSIGHPLISTFSMCFVLMFCNNKRLGYALGLAFLARADVKIVPKEWLEMVEQLLDRERKSAFSQASAKPPDLADQVAQLWQDEKAKYNVTNDGFEDLFKLSGLGKIKDTFWNVYQSVGLAKRQGRSLKEKRLNICLCGNPGTGKTTVARIYATFLADLEALSGSAFVETTGAKLVHEGVDGLKKLLAEIDKEGGGLLFIDEAYQLDPKSELTGRHVMDFLLTEVENNIGKLVVAFAGYENKIEKLMEYNEGLPSRFPYSFIFDDYTDEQLHEIFKRTVESSAGSQPFSVDGGLNAEAVKILVARIGRGRGSVGFGNARAVKNEFQRVLERQATRIAAERAAGRSGVDDFAISRQDLLGPDPVEALVNSKAWEELQQMIGLESVKQSVRQLMELVKTNCEREKLRQPLLNVTLNRLFLGNPGTGKTTVAQLYGRILKDLGLLSNGEVVLKKPADFIGSVLGQSDAQTKSILQASLGKVLVIDEAYGLYGGEGVTDPYKTSVIDTIVGEVQNVPGDDRCVLMCGYRKEMETMMANSNPGLARRFAIENAFVFEDYNDDELARILNLKVAKRGLVCPYQAQMAAMDVLSKERRRPNFGNGGSVENCIGMAVQRMQERLKAFSAAERAKINSLEPIDFDPNWNPRSGGVQFDVDISSIFKDLVSCEATIELLNSYKKMAKVEVARGRDPCEKIPMNFLFQGPPGTGKTTVARRIGQFFKALGMLTTDEVVEASATDLIAGYVGQTAEKTKAKLQEGLGRVLFIDEAYRLDPKKAGGAFCQEALDELVDLLTKPEFFGKLVVILAGYKEDITGLLTANAGLQSRFPGRVDFHSFSKEECVRLFKKKLVDEDWIVDDSADGDLLRLFDQLRQQGGWGNGRDIGNLVKKLAAKASNSIDESTITAGVAIPISKQLVIQFLKTELVEKREQSRIMQQSQKRGELLQKLMLPQQSASQQAPPPPITMIDAETAKENGHQPQQDNEEETDVEKAELPLGLGPRDAGVSDEIWFQLIEAARRDALAQQELEAKMRELEELAKQRAEAERQAELERQRAEELARQKREEEARLAREEAERREAEARRIEEERRRREEEAERLRHEQKLKLAMQMKLQQLGLCPAGFQWFDVGNGYRCGGGSHFVSYDQINSYMHS